MADEQTFEVYVTKYALTAGIKKMLVEATFTPTMVCLTSGEYRACFHGEGKEWHRTREGAVTCAKEMRRKKIASLKKAIEKLEKMEF